MCGRENKGGENCPKSQDVASKELSKLLTDQLYQGHVISKWSLNVQSSKKYLSPLTSARGLRKDIAH